MKFYLRLLCLILLLTQFSCKDAAPTTKPTVPEKQLKITKEDSKTEDAVSNIKKPVVPKHYEYLFVTARSGLNYREAPKGTVLGKYPLNTQLKILEYTKVTDQVNDGDNILKGEWLGVEKDTDTVYVFNGFLAASPTTSDIQLYYASSFYTEENGTTRTAFLNLSETYSQNTYTEHTDREENLLLKGNSLSKDTIQFTSRQRKEFLKKINVSESNKVFIYEVGNDVIKTYNVRDLPLIACLNIYFSRNDYQKSESDYEFGFDLGKKFTNENNLVFIGTENPFQTGQLKPMVWEEIKNQEVPKKFSADLILDERKEWLQGYEASKSYKFSMNNLHYYIQDLKKGDRYKHRYLLVIDSKTEKVIYENVQIDSESTYLVPLATENKTNSYEYQWTGALFKNKSSVVFGFISYNFGCPSVTVLDQTEPAIPILCDNRH